MWNTMFTMKVDPIAEEEGETEENGKKVDSNVSYVDRIFGDKEEVYDAYKL